MIVLAYDHRAFEIMQKIRAYLDSKNLEYVVYANEEYVATDSYSVFAKQAIRRY